MSDTLALNLADLVRHYHDRTEAHRAADLLDEWIESRPPVALARLLRDHRDEAIESPTELARREAVDQLMNFYGLLEIGIVAGYVPWPLPPALAARVQRQLANDAVAPYYRDYYPLDLPAMLAARLGGWKGPRRKLTRKSESLLLQFLDISTDTEKNQAIDTFLWFLEDGYERGYALKDCYAALRTAKSYLAHVSVHPSKRDVLDWAVAGVGEYLGFCRELDRLLLETADLPDLQRAMWCHHAYWFRSVAHDMEEVMGRIDRQVRGWARKRASEAVPRASVLRPDARLLRLVRGAYRFRAYALRVPAGTGKPLVSRARREPAELVLAGAVNAPAAKSRR